jgi:hypothetical protein
MSTTTEEPKREHLNKYKKPRWRNMYRWLSDRLPFAVVHEKYEKRDDEQEIADALVEGSCQEQEGDSG